MIFVRVLGDKDTKISEKTGVRGGIMETIGAQNAAGGACGPAEAAFDDLTRRPGQQYHSFSFGRSGRSRSCKYWKMMNSTGTVKSSASVPASMPPTVPTPTEMLPLAPTP